MAVRHGDAVASAQTGIAGLDGQVKLETLPLYGLPEAGPRAAHRDAHLAGLAARVRGRHHAGPALPGQGRRAPRRRTVAGARQGDRAEASLASSTRFIELDAFTWSNNTVRVMGRNVSGTAFDLGAATLSVAVTKRRIP